MAIGKVIVISFQSFINWTYKVHFINHKLYYMKQLLTVMAVVLCAYFSMGFTVHPSNDSTNPTNLRPRFLRWKHTTWVNPWVNTKRVLADNLLLENSATAGRAQPSIAQLTWSGGSIDLSASCYYCYRWLTIPTGIVLTYEFNISYNQFYGQVCWIYDETTGEELFGSYDEYQYCQFTPIAGHQYGISVNY
jgi:hypothetical protein